MITRIEVDDREVKALINALPQSIFKAEKSAVQQTTTWAKKELQSRMITKTGIPPRVFRRFRVKSKRIGGMGGLVWFGVNPVKAGYVGKLSQEEQGASAGEFYFQGGFVAKMRSGHLGIFKRRGKSRLPIDEQTVNIDAGFSVSAEVAQEASEKLKAEFVSRVLQANPGLSQ